MELGIAIISFNRPLYFRKVFRSLEKQKVEADFHLFQDGAKSVFTNKYKGKPQDINRSIEIFRKSKLNNKTEHIREMNYGNAINQYEAIEFMAKKYKYFILVEDDLILGKDYIETLLKLKPFLNEYFSANAGFRRHCEKRYIKKNLNKVIAKKTHWWAELFRSENWYEVKDWFLEYYKYVSHSEYRNRPREAITEYFHYHNFMVPQSSQDAGRDFALFKMGYQRITTVVNRGFYIGEKGLHFSKTLYNRMGFENQIPFEHKENNKEFKL
jgi:hypothetical protein